MSAAAPAHGSAHNAAPPASLAGLQRRALATGGIGLAVLAAGWLMDAQQLYRSWLFAWVFWLGIALGCLGLLMLQHLTGGAWGIVARRFFEAGTRTLPVCAALFLPILFGMRSLYPWADPAVVAADPVLQHKAGYLNPMFFTVRAVLCFAVWIGLAAILNSWSLRQDRGTEWDMPRRLGRLSGPGLGFYVLAMTFASVDWVMSLEPHWYSTIFGFLFAASQALSAMAFTIVVLGRLSHEEPMRAVLTRSHMHDYAKLLFAFVMVWTYLAFSQFLIIWSGNLAEETPYYIARLQGGWEWVALLLVVLQFAVPFLLLVPRGLNFRSGVVVRVALLILAMRLVDLWWMTAPAFHPASLHLHWLDLAAPVAIGGIWVGEFARQLRRQPLLPLGDPHIDEALAHGRH